MNRKIVLIAAALCTVLLASCAARTELTREERVEKLRRQAEKVEQERSERTQVAMRQTYDDLKSEPAKPEPAKP